jgi:hypothetical protein
MKWTGLQMTHTMNGAGDIGDGGFNQPNQPINPINLV